MAIPLSRTRRIMTLLVGLTLALTAACSDDDGGAASSDDADKCEGNTTTGASPGNHAFTATSAAAVSLLDGRAYTVYIADWDLAPGDISASGVPEVPADGTLFTVAITAFNAPDPESLEPLTPGQVVEYTDDWEVLTFVVTTTDDIGTHTTANGAEGTITVTGTGDSFCGSIEYSDDQKALAGTFEAAVES